MRARLVEDDSKPPQTDGPWAYYPRYRPGGQHRLVCRRPRDGGDETILLDGDALAVGNAFFSLAAARHSPDHAKLAWAADDLGSELMTIRVRDLATGRDLDDRVVHAAPDIVWTRDSGGFLYIEQDDNHRPFRVMLHRLGTGQADDVEVFAEPDPAWFIGVSGSLNGLTAMIDVHGHDGSETHVVDLAEPTASPRLVAPRRAGHFYDVLDHGDRFLIRTNAEARDFKIVEAPRASPGEANWRDVVPHREGCYLIDAIVLAGWLVLLARELSRPRLIVVDLANGARHDVAFDEETYALDFETIYEFEVSAHPLRLFVDRPAGGDLRLRLRDAGADAGQAADDPVGLRSGALCHAAPVRARRGRRDRAGVALDAAGRAARRFGAAAALWLRLLRLCGRGALFDQPSVPGRSRVRLRHRPCARRDR